MIAGSGIPLFEKDPNVLFFRPELHETTRMKKYNPYLFLTEKFSVNLSWRE
jgi:hypothetical protein